MAGYKDTLEARVVVSNWMSSHYVVDLLCIWEQFNNSNFNRMGFQAFKNSSTRTVN